MSAGGHVLTLGYDVGIDVPGTYMKRGETPHSVTLKCMYM